MAAINGGGTTAANAASKAAAAACAWTAARSAAIDMAFIHSRYGRTADIIDSDAAPIHCSSTRWTKWPQPVAAELSSAASEFQDDAAFINDVDPGPEYTSAEVTSGGSAPKSIAMDRSVLTWSRSR
ncbi:hypothetical protein NJB14197_53240 [Mycobacterium montefiorense]|uniref:Uncharacterized protein n=1 Tax=Mycobacterium montefiorense TaxID=154654 RepID=A0AA37UZG1_9MYCO|nr:hypothetical protein MmonteBS_47780 [Mycobacterium montefiorense]GKU36495.1 hypothetical protein NJB14191_38410 [Mycobacterium montefiorense]GKU39423.1 hypothetical protein NJB14192_14180 [Mycobacterium montefiorense]GKU44586.1 hypothetical protein NJB14194_12120 [Mycobacterium montefiorense]GKU53972.1 hypothetical protein NJB14195_52130 [Mycobacterium montefiorense]